MVFEQLRLKTINSIAQIHEITGLSPNTIATALGALEKLGIVRELTGKKRDRVYAYAPLLAILNEGTEPL
jgi:hypothetical protein